MERKRKLQEIGDSFYIALPPDWIRHWALEKGSELEISFTDTMVYAKVPAKETAITKILRDRGTTSTRKLLYQGKTFYICVPPKWIRAQKLSKGNVLSIEYSNSDIVTISA